MFHPSQRSLHYKIKKNKDLSFLLNIKYENHKQNDKLHKYLITQGKGQTISNFKLPLTIHYSFQKYDYAGKLLEKNPNKSLNYPKDTQSQGQSQNPSVADAVFMMKLNEKSWFNIELYQKGSKKCQGYHGAHYQICLESIVFKDDNNLISKRNIYEQNRQKAKQLFKTKKYKEALKIYKYSINILSGLSKKIYKPEQLTQLKKYLEISQTNYLKCVAKLNGFGGRYNEEIGKLTKKLTQKLFIKNPQSPVSFYQKAIYLKYENSFDAAAEAIKQGLKQKFSEVPQEAAQQKKALLNMIDEIKKAKERNIRHLNRQEIRKKKTIKQIKQVQWSQDELSD